MWVWKALQDCVPTKLFLFSKGLASNTCCPRCNAEVEDLRHLIVQCPWSGEVWQAVGFDCGIQVSPPLIQWVVGSLEEDGQVWKE